MVDQADEKLADVEGYALEDLAGQLYEERSRRAIGDFPLSERIRGYWDRSDVEIDLVAVNDDERRIRFGTCKRNPDRLLSAANTLKRSADRFLALHGRFNGWDSEYVAIAPDIDSQLKTALKGQGVIPQSLADLTRDL